LGTSHSTDRLLSLQPTQGVRRYVDLHEQTIRSAQPFAQLAIAYESNGCHRSSAASWWSVVCACLDRARFRSLSFLSDASRSSGSACPQARDLDRFLNEFPGEEDTMVRAGLEAVDAYSWFIAECMLFAELMIGSEAQALWLQPRAGPR
jgi:hypothetical protein